MLCYAHSDDFVATFSLKIGFFKRICLYILQIWLRLGVWE